MQKLTILLALLMTYSSSILFDFNSDSNARAWQVVDDVVMGGRSSGQFSINADGHGVFEGRVSLENNGGFSSVRYSPGNASVNPDQTVVLIVKGDGKQYQFRVKDDLGNYYSFVQSFQTSGDWEEIEIPLNSMYASFRGRRVNVPNFSGNQIAEVRFLIANKKAEDFKLLIDKIEIR